MLIVISTQTSGDHCTVIANISDNDLKKCSLFSCQIWVRDYSHVCQGCKGKA